MRIFLNFIIFSIQGLVTFILIFVIYMIFVLLDYQSGIDGFIGTTIFQPIIGGLISIFSIGICILVGLPIRLNKKLNSWWTRNYFISVLGTLTGLGLLITSLLPPFKESVKLTVDDQELIKLIPNMTFAITGWFLTTFSTLHIFPTENFKLKTEKIIKKYSGRRKIETPANSG